MGHGRALIDRFPWSVQGIAITVLLSLAAIAIVIAQSDSSTPGLEPLYENRSLSPVEQQRIDAALSASNLINYQIRDGQLLVPLSERSRYSAAIAAANCLQGFHSPTEEALRNSSLIEAGGRRADRLDHAREQEARLALLAIPGIEDAFVYFDETGPQGLRGARNVTASVGVRTAVDYVLDLEAAKTIQRVVLRIKAGLTPEGITVADLQSRHSFQGADLVDPESSATRFLVLRGRQQQLELQLRSMLATIPGARVGVQMQTDENETTSDVRVSVGVPSSYLDQIAATERSRDQSAEQPARSQLEARVRSSIQAAIVPLLPKSGRDEAATDRITITMFDDPLSVVTTRAGGISTLPRRILMVGVLAIAACATLLFLAGRRRDAPPRLKLHTEAEPVGHDDDERPPDQAGETSLHHQLRVLVDDDPDAAARSLSDWIDQAG
jgi:flagellar biosynthesis/type III secretory pathway M-ring protein FliF/YscJ